MHTAWTESARRQVQGDQLRTALFCLNLTKNVLSQSWPQLTAKLLPVPRESAAVVQVVFENLKRASTGLGVFTWEGHRGRMALVEAIANTSVAVRLPFQKGVDYSGLFRDEANVTAEGKSSSSTAAPRDTKWAMRYFFSVYFRAMLHDRLVEFSHPPSRLQTLLWRQGHTGKMRYIPAVRTVLVPGIYQMEPYTYFSTSTEEYMPEYINYGTLGSLLSFEVARIVNRRRKGASRGRLGNTGQRGRTGSGNSYLDRLYCLLDLHSSLG
ncbi:hypothetical protein HPB50_028978 [Hyalomma asiaticum]|nr:hypothetical protein HPB50_028978 [Hyalomma asiaticum]